MTKLYNLVRTVSFLLIQGGANAQGVPLSARRVFVRSVYAGEGEGHRVRNHVWTKGPSIRRIRTSWTCGMVTIVRRAGNGMRHIA
jgi:hypothetical protein